jgi:CelD/BcsL family acetyltransferase involved in cellulose biosynthesis
VTLAGHTWESYLASLGASHRANLRRRLRGLSQAFEIRFEQIASEPNRREALAALIAFHEERFGRRGSTTFLTPALRAFHDEATRRMLESGWLRLHVLRLNGAIAGVMYGFAYNHRFYFYQHGFDPQYEPFSAGLVLMGLTIRAALEDGAIEFDMLYGTERYKSLWVRDQRSLFQVQMFPPHLAGLLQRRTVEAERSMRTVARRILTMGGVRAT